MEEKEIIGALHSHSTYSYDAKLSLRELKSLLQERGIHFVCMTEHTDDMSPERASAFVQECADLSDDTFLFIPGFEVPYHHAHVLMIGARAFHSAYAPTGKELGEWAQSAKFVVLAHPVRNDFLVDATLLSYIDGLEVWNQQYEGKHVPRTRSLVLFKDLKEKKPELVATGGIDLHRSEHVGAPVVTLRVSEFTEDAIIEKLKMGAFSVSSEHSLIYGTLPDVEEMISKYRCRSAMAVGIILFGKLVNRILASLGLSLPKEFKQLIRRKI